MEPEIAELIKVCCAVILAGIGLHSAYRLARSKVQIARVISLPTALRVANGGETKIFVARCGVIIGFCTPVIPINMARRDESDRCVEPGQSKLWDWSHHGVDPPEISTAKNAWALLQSGAVISTLWKIDPRRVVLANRVRKLDYEEFLPWDEQRERS